MQILIVHRVDELMTITEKENSKLFINVTLSSYCRQVQPLHVIRNVSVDEFITFTRQIDILPPLFLYLHDCDVDENHDILEYQTESRGNWR